MMKILTVILMLMIENETCLRWEAVRIEKTAAIVLNGSVDHVFPLFGPIREKDWAEGWEPQILYGETEAEEHMMFTSKSRYPDEQVYTWVVTKLEPARHLIEYTVSAPGRIWFITVSCEELHRDKTRATITYSFTALEEKAVKRNQESLDKMFAHQLTDWQEAINYYLATGQKLVH
jgi:hypothetical protein